MRLIILTFWSFFQVFVFCESSEYIARQFDDVDIYMLWDWYTYPTVIQRIFPIVQIDTQKPVVLQGFGNISCTRETFKRVIFIQWFYEMKFSCFLHSVGG